MKNPKKKAIEKMKYTVHHPYSGISYGEYSSRKSAKKAQKIQTMGERSFIKSEGGYTHKERSKMSKYVVKSKHRLPKNTEILDEDTERG